MHISNVIHAVDLHACGEHGRVIVGGILDVPGTSMFEKMCYLEKNMDWLRKCMLREPRGYPAANCNLILPATDPRADAGFVIMEQIEYPPMSGTNTICVVTALIELGLVECQEPETRLTLESPAGLIEVKAEVQANRVMGVTFRNVPAFAVHLDQTIDVPKLGKIVVDVAWGGMFYVITEAEPLGLSLRPDEAVKIARCGEMIKAAAKEQLECFHPENPEVSGITIGVISGPPEHPDATLKNAAIVSTGTLDWNREETWTAALDRSPCGTGTCAKMAVLHAKGELALQEEFFHEGILGTIFTGKLTEKCKVGPYDAVIPEITGRAWITANSHYMISPDDPFPEGYRIGDIWAGAS